MDLITAAQDGLEPLNTTADRDLLSVDISVTYSRGPAVLHNLVLTVGTGEILGLIGASGSGKSTLAMSVLRLVPLKGGSVSGVISFCGRNLLALSEREMRAVRGKEISFVPQSPISSLNPALTIGTQFREAWRAHCGNPDWKHRVFELLSKVSLPATEAFLKSYPRHLSVGMAQRVLVAMAALHRPKLLIADEPTSALDVINATAILDLLRMLNREEGTAVLCISHDLLSVARLCHRIAILNQGEVVETGALEVIFSAPQHSYTVRLVEAHRALGQSADQSTELV